MVKIKIQKPYETRRYSNHELTLQTFITIIKQHYELV